MTVLFILNDPPYGSERGYNALRLANTLKKRDKDSIIHIFLMADAVLAAKKGQETPDGYYNMERMLKRFATSGSLLLCGTCMAARGLREEDMLDGATKSTMDELAELTIAAGKVLVW